MDKFENINMNCADIILVRSKTWVNWAVRLVTQSRWGHSAMYIGDGLFVESDIGGVKVKHVKELNGKEILVLRHKRMKDVDAHKICTGILEDLGKGYDYKALWDLLRLLLTGKRVSEKEVGSRKKFICSEVIAKQYYELGYPIIKEYSYDEIIPFDFDESRHFNRIY